MFLETNPGDDPTRACFSSDVINNSNWWNGPEVKDLFLQKIMLVKDVN